VHKYILTNELSHSHFVSVHDNCLEDPKGVDSGKVLEINTSFLFCCIIFIVLLMNAWLMFTN